MKIDDFLKVPTVIGVGAPRAGTTWLDTVLRQHPSIQMPHNVKELWFFSSKYTKGIDWYLSHFLPFKTEAKYWGEVSTSYLCFPSTAERIKTLVPGAKIIISLRSPYERVTSMYGYYRMCGGHLDLLAAVKQVDWFKKELLISQAVELYCNTFDKKSIYFMIYDDLKRSPEILADEICRFLGLEKVILSAISKKRIHASKVPRSLRLANMAAVLQNILRNRLELDRLANFTKFSRFTNRLMFKNSKFEVPENEKLEAYSYLESFLEEEVVSLERIVGRSFAHWSHREPLKKQSGES